MTSHRYQFSGRDISRVLTIPLAVVLMFALIMHAGVWFNWWPAPHPTLDVDRTILLHQAHAASSTQSADLLLIGDSSCLMDVSARRLEELLGRQAGVLNLGTLSYLDLQDYSQLLRRHVETNPGRLKTVVLLMHPEALRRSQPNPLHVELLRDALAGRDSCRTDTLRNRMACLAGLEIFRGRMFSRVIPSPLPGKFGARYGFASELWDYLSAHNGSAIDPASLTPAGRRIDTDYRLSERLRESSRAFRAAVPQGVHLVVGITPCAESFVAAGHRQTVSRMLTDWSGWLQADARLDAFPAVLPDDQFARPAGTDSNPVHLNERGNEAYTRRFAEILNQPGNR